MSIWSVGDATITAVVESSTPTSPRFLFEDGSLTKDDTKALRTAEPWLAPYIDENGFLLQRIQCLIIEVDDRVIAVDTCVGNDKARANDHWAHLDGPFLDDMAAAGFPPDRVTDVICTHLHVDHVGWNTRWDGSSWVPTFPNARYIFVDAEFEHWRNEQSLFPGDDVFGDSVAPIAEAGLADLVAGDHVVCPSVRLVPTVGHTPGHASVEVRSGGRRAVITGDMAHHPLQLADPDRSSKFDTDPYQARATRHTAFADWSDGATLVLGTHFGEPTGGILMADGTGYRLEPPSD